MVSLLEVAPTLGAIAHRHLAAKFDELFTFRHPDEDITAAHSALS
jgi:hypothetical protein